MNLLQEILHYNVPVYGFEIDLGKSGDQEISAILHEINESP